MAVEASTLHMLGQLLIAVLFLGTALINSTTMVKQHRDRMVALDIPLAGMLLWAGFVIQYAGALSLLFNYYSAYGASALIVFTIAATAIFHRFWRVEDAFLRHLHRSFVFSNIGIVGGLLLVISGSA